MACHLTPIDGGLGAGEVGSLVGLPIYDDSDQAELCLTADEWAELLTRRRRVGWPLHFVEAANLAVTHA